MFNSFKNFYNERISLNKLKILMLFLYMLMHVYLAIYYQFNNNLFVF